MAKIEHSIEVNVPVGTAYNQLTQFEEYPRFMEDVEEVRQLDDTHLHWHTRTGNLDMQWDAEITQQVPDRCIAWRNINEPRHEGKIELHPIKEDRTKVTLTMEYEPGQQILAQHGDAKSAIAQRTKHDLARFKEFMEKLGSETGAWRGRVSDAQPIPPQGAATAEQPAQDAQAESGTQQKQGDKWTTRPPSWMPNFMQVWDEPLNMMRRMSEDMDHLFDRFIGGPLAGARQRTGAPLQPDAPASAWTPPVEIAQRNDRFVVCAELAGVKREDVRVEIKSDRLTIEGDRRREPPHAPQEQRRSERSYGHFYRVIELPPGADPDAASASMHDGMLEITVPVHDNASKGRRIDIQSPQ